MNQELNPDKPVKFIQVSAGMVFRNGLLLIAQRRTGDHLGGFWEFPGGKQEPGETAEECLQRELREELAIEVAVHELVETVEHSYPDRSFCLKFFRCTWTSGEPQAIGCQNFAWVTADQLADYKFPEADIQLLEKLRNSPGLWR